MIQYTPRVEKIVAYIRAFRREDGGVALDLGAGSGAFALCLKNSGYFRDVMTLDIAESCVNACRNCGLSAGQGTIADAESGSIDLISMNDLIEHVFDPLTLLKDCRRALRTGGFIAIATPNGEGFDFRILKEQTKNIAPPEHINYFNPRSIAILLERAGFIPVSLETPGILDVEIIRNAKESGFPLKEKNEYLDYLLKQDDDVLKKFQEFIADNGLSSHMLAVAQKNE
jgi:SAM-dependent methyltransferase